jgi:hypothetical protein
MTKKQHQSWTPVFGQVSLGVEEISPASGQA